MIFVQIGAGASDLDPRTNFNEGFASFVKKKVDKNKKIFLVEANPKNIKYLKKSWKKYKNVKIFNIAIVAKKIKKKIKMFYCKEDCPHYQTMSTSFGHVKKHYPNNKIDFIFVDTISINNFFNNNFATREVDYLAMDVEGLEYAIIMNLNLNKFIIKNISFEYLHLSKTEKKKIVKKLQINGYFFNGYGFDKNNFDWLFSKNPKKNNVLRSIITKILPYLRRKHISLINKLII